MKVKSFVIFKIPVIICVSLVSIFIVLKFANSIYIPKDFEDKKYLLNNYPSIFFAGDSRAERQLNPIIASNILDIDKKMIANIAGSSADVAMLSEFIKQNKQNFENAIVFISVSAFELNDGLVQPGYISHTTLSKLSPLEQLWISKNHPFVLLQYVRQSFKKNTTTQSGSNAFMQTLGFNPIMTILKSNNFDKKSETKNPSYKNWHPNGMRQKIFEEALVEIAQNVRSIYVYSGPISPIWRNAMSNSDEYKYEIEFQDITNAICIKNHISYTNFFENTNFINEDFYDNFHLNQIGAEKLTNIIINFIYPISR